MSALQVPINADDREHINAMVAQFRHSIENLYCRAYLQGQIDQCEADRAKLRGDLAKMEGA